MYNSLVKVPIFGEGPKNTHTIDFDKTQHVHFFIQ